MRVLTCHVRMNIYIVCSEEMDGMGWDGMGWNSAVEEDEVGKGRRERLNGRKEENYIKRDKDIRYFKAKIDILLIFSLIPSKLLPPANYGR